MVTKKSKVENFLVAELERVAEMAGKKGVIQARERLDKLKKAHEKHMANMSRRPYHGFYDNTRRTTRRHGAGDPIREKRGRWNKIMRRLLPMIKGAPVECLERWLPAIGIPLTKSDKGYTQLAWHPAAKTLIDYISAYRFAVSEDRISADGTIYRYEESVEWGTFGKRSYPRVCDRRIMAITREGSERVRLLEAGERSESAIDDLIPGRKERRKEAKKQAKRIVYKAVAVVDGEYRSIFNGEKYEIMIPKKQTAQPNHGGGYYWYPTPSEARDCDVPESSQHYHADRTVLECEAAGKIIRYNNGKHASSVIIPIREV